MPNVGNSSWWRKPGGRFPRVRKLGQDTLEESTGGLVPETECGGTSAHYSEGSVQRLPQMKSAPSKHVWGRDWPGGADMPETGSQKRASELQPPPGSCSRVHGGGVCVLSDGWLCLCPLSHSCGNTAPLVQTAGDQASSRINSKSFVLCCI